MQILEIVFWFAIGFIAYAYLGYPLFLFLLGRLRRRRIPRAETEPLPSVTLLISAYNEERVLLAKLENAVSLDYPRDQLDIIVVSDGSTDRTDAIVEECSHRGVRLVRCPARMGKSHALNYVMPMVRSDLVVFSDANSLYDSKAVREIVRPFADPEVGCVTGRLVYNGNGSTLVGKGEGLYWRYENLLSRLESRLGSVLVSTGTIFAIRRHLFPRLDGDVANDFQIPMEISAKGFQVVYSPDAIAREQTCEHCWEEFDRKVRIILRGLVGFRKLPKKTPALRLFQFFSHKLARWLIGPALVLLLATNIALAANPFYQIILAMQFIFYSLATIGWIWHNRTREIKTIYVPFYFTMVNLAATTALARYFAGHRLVTWEKAETSRAEPLTEPPADSRREELGALHVLPSTGGLKPEVGEATASVVEKLSRP